MVELVHQTTCVRLAPKQDSKTGIRKKSMNSSKSRIIRIHGPALEEPSSQALLPAMPIQKHYMVMVSVQKRSLLTIISLGLTQI